MKIMIPIANLCLALITIYLKVIYGGLHWFISDLCAIKPDIDMNILGHAEGPLGSLDVMIILISLLSVIIGLVSIKEKLCNLPLGIIILGICCISFGCAFFISM